MSEDIEMPKGSSESITSQLFGLVFIALFFLGLNWMGGKAQDWWHREDRAQLAQLKVALEAENTRIETTDQQLEELKSRHSTLEAELNRSSAELSRLDNAFSESGSETVREEYNNIVTTHNETVASLDEVVDTYNSLLPLQQTKIDAYNSEVEKASQLAEKCGSQWYIIPVPGGGRSKITGPAKGQ